MSFTKLIERAYQTQTAFGDYLKGYLPQAEALKALLCTHPSYDSFMKHIATTATTASSAPYLFEEYQQSFRCLFLHKPNGADSKNGTSLSDKSLHFAHVLSTMVGKALKDGAVAFVNEGEETYSKNTPFKTSHEEERETAFLWPFYSNGRMAVRVVLHTFSAVEVGEDTVSTIRHIDHATLTCLMICALAHRIEKSESYQGSDKPDVLFSRTAPVSHYKREYTRRGIRVSLYADDLTVNEIASKAMTKLFQRHAVQDDLLQAYATILAQGAFSDTTWSDVVNETGMDHYVFTPCHLHKESDRHYTAVGYLIGMKDGHISYGQVATLSGSPGQLVLSSKPEWMIGVVDGSAVTARPSYDFDMPPTANFSLRCAANQEGTPSEQVDYYSALAMMDVLDNTIESQTVYKGAGYYRPEVMEINFFAHPHPVYADMSLHEATMLTSDAQRAQCLIASYGRDGRDVSFAYRYVRPEAQDIARYSSAWRSFTSFSSNDLGPITKPLLMALNRIGVRARRVSYLLHEMLTEHNPYPDLYRAIRKGMTCRKSAQYNTLVAAINASPDKKLAEARIIQFAALYPTYFSSLTQGLAFGFAMQMATCSDKGAGGKAGAKELLPDFFLGVMRDIVQGKPVFESMCSSEGLSRALMNRLGRCKIRTKEHKIVKKIMNSDYVVDILCFERALELCPDMTLTQCTELYEAVKLAAQRLCRSTSLPEKNTKATSMPRTYAEANALAARSRSRHFSSSSGEDIFERYQEKIIASLTRHTVSLFKRWRCSDIRDTLDAIDTICDTGLQSSCNTPPEFMKTVPLMENFYRTGSTHSILGDIMALTERAHRRTDVIQELVETVPKFRLYRPDTVIPDPRQTVWSTLTQATETYRGVRIRCLGSESDLKEEGHALNHCVGGYLTNAWLGHVVLGLCQPANGKGAAIRSTAHLIVVHVAENQVRKSFYTLRLIQHRGYDNKDAPAKHEAALKAFIKAHEQDQDRLHAIYNQMIENKAALFEYENCFAAQQHIEERMTIMSLRWPQIAFFMRKKIACPYPSMDEDRFKALFIVRQEDEKRKSREKTISALVKLGTLEDDFEDDDFEND